MPGCLLFTNTQLKPQHNAEENGGETDTRPHMQLKSSHFLLKSWNHFTHQAEVVTKKWPGKLAHIMMKCPLKMFIIYHTEILSSLLYNTINSSHIKYWDARHILNWSYWRLSCWNFCFFIHCMYCIWGGWGAF